MAEAPDLSFNLFSLAVVASKRKIRQGRKRQSTEVPLLFLKEGERIKQDFGIFKIENSWCGLFTQIYLKIR